MTTVCTGGLALVDACDFCVGLFCCPVEDDLFLSEDEVARVSVGTIVLDLCGTMVPFSALIAAMRATLCEGLVILSCCASDDSVNVMRRSPSIPPISNLGQTLDMLMEISHLHTSSTVHDRTPAILCTSSSTKHVRMGFLSLLLQKKPPQFRYSFPEEKAELQCVQNQVITVAR